MRYNIKIVNTTSNHLAFNDLTVSPKRYGGSQPSASVLNRSIRPEGPQWFLPLIYKYFKLCTTMEFFPFHQFNSNL